VPEQRTEQHTEQFAGQRTEQLAEQSTEYREDAERRTNRGTPENADAERPRR
jgi:hypothetical protein